MTINRTELINALRDLADFLDTNPDVPTPNSAPPVSFFPPGDDDGTCRAQVDAVAAYLGTQIAPEARTYGHYMTAIHFGPIRYEVVAIDAERRARHDAHFSYAGCVDPDPINTPETAGRS